MKNYFFKILPKSFSTIIFLIPIISVNCDYLNAEYLLKELQVDSSTKTEDDSSVIPTNPFEIVEIIRRYNSLNDATNPSDAIDDALKSFNNVEEERRNLTQ